MKNVIQIAAYTAAGLAVVGGSFLLFAALSGTPLSEVAGLGDLVPEPEGGEVVADRESPDPMQQVEADARGARQVYDEAASPLRAFVLENPFDAGQLEALEQRLQDRLLGVRERERALDQREAELQRSMEHVERLYAELEELRTQVLGERDALEGRRDELAADAQAAAEREDASWKAVAALFEGETKPATAAQMMIDGYEAPEAARILEHLDPDRQRELLQAIHKLDPESFKAFEQALRSLR